MADYNTVIKLIEYVKYRKGLENSDIAKVTGVSEISIKNYLNKQTVMPLDVAMDIMDAFGFQFTITARDKKRKG